MQRKTNTLCACAYRDTGYVITTILAGKRGISLIAIRRTGIP